MLCKELQELQDFLIGFDKFKSELILKRDAAKRLFECAFEKEPNKPETSALLIRLQALDEALQLMEKSFQSIALTSDE